MIKQKDYNNWNSLKQKINFDYNTPFHPKVKEVWWVNIGLNIGSEIYGKGDSYTRPVLVIKVFSKNFIGIPLTSNIKSSKYKVVIYTKEDSKYHSIVLNQLKLLDRKRLIKRKYILSNNKFKKIIYNLKNMITTN